MKLDRELMKMVMETLQASMDKEVAVAGWIDETNGVMVLAIAHSSGNPEIVTSLAASMLADSLAKRLIDNYNIAVEKIQGDMNMVPEPKGKM